MRIAFILTNFPSSGNTFITNQKTGLIDLGHDIFIFANSPQSNFGRSHENIVKYKLVQKTKYYGKRKGILDAVEILIGDLKNNPLSTIKLAVKSFDRRMFERQGRLLLKGSAFFDKDIVFGSKEHIHNAYLMLRTFKDFEHVEIWNAHFGPVGCKMLFLKEMYPKAKFVANFHGYDFSSYVRIFGCGYYDKLFKLADLITTQSYFSRDCLIALGCPPRKVLKHPVGADLDLFKFNPRHLEDGDKPVRLTIASRFVEKKGHRILLDAFAKVTEREKNVELHLIGSGELEPEIKKQISQHNGLKRQTILHSWMTHEQLAEHLNRTHIFIQPSITTMQWAEQEDTTTTLIEAQAMGIPVIATYHAGIPEVVEHGKTGLLVPERNVRALYDAIWHLINCPEKRQEMGAAARSMVEKKFDIKILNKKLEYVFQKLIKLPANKFIDLESTEEIILKDEPFVVEKVADDSFPYPILDVCGGAVRSARQ